MNIEEYMSFVSETIEKFRGIGNLVTKEEIDMYRINRALATYYDVSLSLNAEYQRAKMEFTALEMEQQEWYDRRFTEAKEMVLAEYSGSKSIKPSLKEFEVQMRVAFVTEWKEWTEKLAQADAKVQFLLRMRELLNKYDNILATLSYNIRSEMKSLSMEDRQRPPV